MRCLASSLNTANGEARASPSPPARLRVNSTDPNGGRRFQRRFTESARGNSRVGPPKHGGGGPRQNARVVRRRRRGRNIQMIASAVAIAVFDRGKNKRSRWLAVLVFPRFREGAADPTEFTGLRHLRSPGRRWLNQSKLACASSQRGSGEFVPGRLIVFNSSYLGQSGDLR